MDTEKILGDFIIENFLFGEAVQIKSNLNLIEN